jgi:hypothetical protein
MTTFVWHGTLWFDASTNTVASLVPGAGDTLFVPPGSTASNAFGPTGTEPNSSSAPYANIFVGVDATVNFAEPLADDEVSHLNFATNNLFIGAGSDFTLEGSIEGYPVAWHIQAGNVFLAKGATLDLFGPPVDSGFLGPDRITNLFNNGGDLIVPTGNDVLQLGGPGFVQTSGFTSGESEIGGQGAIANLGNIVQGGVAAAIDEMINNAPAGGTFGFLSPDNAFTLAQGSNSATLDVNTFALGTHAALLSYTAGNVHDMLTITDRIVPA